MTTIQRCATAAFISAALSATPQVQAYGFGDQGFLQTPIVRTDLLSPTEGTAGNPLKVSGCHFGQNPCPTLRTVFAQPNYWSQNWPSSCIPGFDCPSHWWTVVMNNEPVDAAANPGPPDASLARVYPGGGTMGFTTLFGNDNFPGDTYWRAHLVLNMSYANPIVGGIPFLGFGAFAGHGNQGPIGALRPSNPNVPHILKFDSKLWYFELPQPCCGATPVQLQTITNWLQIFANWGTYPKMVQIALWHQSRDPRHPSVPDPYLSGSVPVGQNMPWDWRYTHSGYYPGAKMLSLTAESISAVCGFSVPHLVLNQDVHYSIDLQQLFSCLNAHHYFDEPMPTTYDIPVTIVDWASEGTGLGGGLWTDVHNMRMVGASAGLADQNDGDVGAPRDDSLPPSAAYGPGTEAIGEAFKNSPSASN
jgi:hypothetical protein